MQLHDFLAQCQAQARTALLAAHLYKGFEDPPLLAVGNAFAVVLDADNHPLAMPSCLQANLPAFGGVAQGIAQQVVEHPLQLHLVGIQPWQLRLSFYQQLNVLGVRRLSKPSPCVLQQVGDIARAQGEFLQAVLVARKVEQVVDQLHQALHFFIHRIQQVRLAGVRWELGPLTEQAEGHVHAGNRRAQLMGGAQYELAAHPFEGALFSHIMQHHHGPENVPLCMADRGQAVGQQAQLTLDFHLQIVRGPLQVAAAQHQLQLFIHFRTTHGFTKALTQPLLIPAQLALRYRVEVLQAALAINHQQAVIDTVEHRLQALLAGQQFIDVSGLMLAQRFGHDAETAGQQVHFRCGGDRQRDFKVALPDLVGGLGQGLDGTTETPGDAMGRDETDDQHREPYQPEQARYQQGALTGFMLTGTDIFQGPLVVGDQAVAQYVEGLGELFLAARRR